MPHPPSRVEARRKFPVDASFLALLALIIVSITTLYVSSERNFHWWIDWYNRTLDVVTAFQKSPSKAIQEIQQSLVQERNRLFTLPLVPFILAFGSSRLVYEISLALVYLLPLPLVMGAIATQLIQAHSRTVFWLTALLTLLIPVGWMPTFIGIPDTGGAVLIGLATLVYLQDVRLKQWWRIPLIGLLIGLSILLRRHFVYGGIAFFGALTVQALLFFALEVRKIPQKANSRWDRFRFGNPYARALRNLLSYGVQIGLIAATTLTTLLIVAPEFTHRALTTNYRTLYTSWTLPFGDIVKLYASFYGWATWLMVAIGLVLGILTRALVWEAISFVSLWGVFSLIVWLGVLRYANVFYSLHVTPLVAIGLIIFIWITWIKLSGKVRTLVLAVVGCYLVSNLVIGLSPIGKFDNFFRPLFAINIPPLVRTDYDEVVRLVNYLRQLTPNKELIYVVGYQRLQLDSSLLIAAERVLYSPKRRTLNILFAPQVDSRDFYPIESLLQAKYVVVPNPLPDYPGDPTKVPAVGEWLPNKELDVVKVVFDAFTQNWKFAQDFKRLPVQFALEGGAVVNIYQRIRPTSMETAMQTLDEMQQRIGERPGGQHDWLILSQPLNRSFVNVNPDNTYRVVFYYTRRHRLSNAAPSGNRKAVAYKEREALRASDRRDSDSDSEALATQGASERASARKLSRSAKQNPKGRESPLADTQRSRSLRPRFTRSADPTYGMGTSFLYLGALPEKAEVSGAITFLAKPCVKSSLRLAVLNKQGQVISSTEEKYITRNLPRFKLSVRGTDSAYLLLDVLNYDKNNSINFCTLELNNLTVSPQK
jgi:hypothetical protein